MNFMKTTALAAIVVGSLTVGAIAQDKTYTIGVSVPTADHGWTGGVDFFAQQAVDRLSKAYPNLKFVLATAPDSTKQAADLEDMVTTRNIDGLVILPGDPDAMTASIKKVKDAGKWVTVVDRALSQPGIPDLYVAGDNPGLGATTAAYFKQAMPDGGKIVIEKNGTMAHFDAAGKRVIMRDGVAMEAKDGSKLMMKNNEIWKTISTHGTLKPGHGN